MPSRDSRQHGEVTECHTRSKGWMRDVLFLSIQTVFYSDLSPNSSPDEGSIFWWLRS